ncbi:aldose 1-epimerase [Aliiruegeria haliotis]|uniref:Aldose 1-epimerase n=1 Tax=Aliiruegeria haliotis TaxID=1280846 RepID=A0A2T0RFN9_9RHOB|nr:aldose 1-epimerase [Aliiruegeria haliotis]PRY19952.1 aldose 1-epimerase [Aliiruegeria haliotis]
MKYGSGNIELRAGQLSATVRPEYGGRILRFSTIDAQGTWDWFLPTDPAAPMDRQAPQKAGCYPLVPFSNRLRDGQLNYRGRNYPLAAHPQCPPHAMHGDGHLAEWDVADQGLSHVTITFDHRPGHGTWPFPYRARQSISLTDTALTIDFNLTNTGPDPMPGGIGLHPYFPRIGNPLVKMGVGAWWPAPEDLIPLAMEPASEDLDYSDFRDLPANRFTHCLDQWDRKAAIQWPEHGRALTVSATGALDRILFHVVPGLPFFCIEPISHTINAFNLQETGVPGTGTRVLSGGESLTGTAIFSVA